MKEELQEIGFLKKRGFNVDEEDNGYSISVHPRQHIHCKSLFIEKDEMSAIHKLGVIIKIEVHDYIRVEIIRNVSFIYFWHSVDIRNV
jgi:hypothetical protein